ncbi:MAG TPA: hypothetical protein DCL44_04400 [Elusimicrobia bacterium]|nr:hypothetical protein [Elusimicrobiota bacterium]
MPRKILLADDDERILKLYARIFTGKDYLTTKASSFREAADLIKVNDYDLLVTDLQFPDGLGTELIKFFEKKRSGSKSLLVTGSLPSREELADTGVSEYLEKPLNIEKFISVVEKKLNA